MFLELLFLIALIRRLITLNCNKRRDKNKRFRNKYGYVKIEICSKEIFVLNFK